MSLQAETFTCKSHVQYSRLDKEQYWIREGNNHFTLAEIAEKGFFFSSSVKLSGYSQCIQLTYPFPQHHLERRKSQSLSNSNKVLSGFTEKRILSILLANDHGSPPHTTPALSIKTCCLKFWKEGKQQEGKLEVM